MDRELRVNLSLYLMLQEDEIEEMAESRMFDILQKAQELNSGFSMSEFYETEIQEV